MMLNDIRWCRSDVQVYVYPSCKYRVAYEQYFVHVAQAVVASQLDAEQVHRQAA